MSFCLAIIRGTLSSPPQVRLFESGSRLATLQVTVREPGKPTVSVPVAVWDPPAGLEELGAGDEVVVSGRIERRFFSAAGGRLSKVELVASEVVPGDDRRRMSVVYRRARAAIDAAAQQR